MKNLKNIIAIVALAVLCIGCEVTPYKHIIKSEAGNDIGIRCALVGGIPVACAFFHETKVEVPIEVLVGVVVERVVEVEKVVEVQTIVEKETIVESITTEYINTEIDANTFVQSVIARLPEGVTRQNYDYQEVVAAVQHTIVTYTPEPTQTTKATTIVTEKVADPPPPIVTQPAVITQKPPSPPPPRTAPTIITPKPTNPPPPRTAPPPVVVEDTPKTIRVDGGNGDTLETGEPVVLTIRTGEHDPFNCEGDHPSVTAYKDGAVRDHQHWGACEVDGEIVVFLKDHPALTCEVGPNRHELEIEGLDEKVIVEEGCE